MYSLVLSWFILTSIIDSISLFLLPHSSLSKGLVWGITRCILAIADTLPPVAEMPDNVQCVIKLKSANSLIACRSYPSPRKYRDAWQTLIQGHVDAGRLRPSSSPYASPVFLVPKSDPKALPRFVNDYRILNKNTVTDKYPLPRIDDILADAGKRKNLVKARHDRCIFPHQGPPR